MDPDGRRIFISGTKEYRNQILGILQNLAASSKTGRQLVYDAITSDDILLVAENDKSSNGISDKTTDQNGDKKALLTFNVGEASQDLPASEGQGDKGIVNTPGVAISHELQHFNDFSAGTTFGYVQNQNNPYDDQGNPNYFSESELSAVDAENKVRAEMGLSLRTHYGGVNVFNKQLRNKSSYTLINKRNPTDYSTFFKSNTTLGRSKNKFQSQINAWWQHSFRTRTGKNTRYGFPSDKVTLTPKTGSTQISGYNKK